MFCTEYFSFFWHIFSQFHSYTFKIVNDESVLTAVKLHHHLVAVIIITLTSLMTAKCKVNTTLKCICFKLNVLNNMKICTFICNMSVVLLDCYILDLCMLCLVFCVLQNTQRISSSQSTQPLATPVVSVTTPSLPPQGLVYSGMPTSYNPAGESGLALASHWTQPPQLCLFVLHAIGSWSFLSGAKCCSWNVSEFSLCVAAFVFTEYSLSSAEISSLQGFSSPGLSLGSMSAWQQHQLGQAALNSLVWVTHF